MDEAVKTATYFYDVDTLDKEILDELYENKKRMLEGREILKWWEK